MAPNGYAWLQMAPNGSNWLQKALKSSRWLQFAQNFSPLHSSDQVALNITAFVLSTTVFVLNIT